MCSMPSKHLPDLCPSESLEKFVDRHLRPTDHFKSYMLQFVLKVVTYLQQFKQYGIKEVVKSGSLGKGTSYGQTADVDLVVFFNGYKNMDSFLRDKPYILKALKKYMCNTEPENEGWLFFCRSRMHRPDWIDGIKVVRTTDYHVEFEVQMLYSGKRVKMKLDILPTIDVIYMHSGYIRDNLHSVYQEIKTKSKQVQGHYSVCFCKLQIRLYDSYMAKVKDLIRLLKYWRTSNGLKLKSYGCEVLALWVYKKRLNENRSFKMLTGFKEALQVLSRIETNNVVPSFTGMENEYMKCFNDPINPYSTTIPNTGYKHIRKCADDTLQSMENVTVDSESCSIM